MGKRQVKNESQLKELKIPEEGEMFGRVIKMMGGENVLVKCTDGTTRRGRIRGKLKRRVWIRDNDIVIIAPWGFGDEDRGDILWRYTLPQVDWLKQNEKIPIDF
ncbi:MAG: translation initiation factor eIF-1A [Nitrosopumilaceae archaeon]